MAQGALIFSVYPKVPANNVGELVKVLKADPQKYSFATSGFGSAGHLAAASFLHDNGLAQIPIVLYRGGGPALSDLVGGQVQGLIDPMPVSYTHLIPKSSRGWCATWAATTT